MILWELDLYLIDGSSRNLECFNPTSVGNGKNAQSVDKSLLRTGRFKLEMSEADISFNNQ